MQDIRNMKKYCLEPIHSKACNQFMKQLIERKNESEIIGLKSTENSTVCRLQRVLALFFSEKRC